jgi:hypothetical protein
VAERGTTKGLGKPGGLELSMGQIDVYQLGKERCVGLGENS